MAENNFSGVIESLMKGMNAVIGTKTVVGDATQVGDTIILPLVDVSFGVGAGAGTGDKKSSGAGGFSAKDDSQRGAGNQERHHEACQYQESGYGHQGARYDSGYCGEIYISQGRNAG